MLNIDEVRFPLKTRLWGQGFSCPKKKNFGERYCILWSDDVISPPAALSDRLKYTTVTGANRAGSNAGEEPRANTASETRRGQLDHGEPSVEAARGSSVTGCCVVGPHTLSADTGCLPSFLHQLGTV